MQITENLFVAYCHCAYKAFLKSKREVGEVVDYEAIQKEADARFRDEAIERLLRSHAESQVSREPASLRLAVKEGVKLIVGATVEALGVALSFDLLELLVDRDDDRRVVCVPVQFSHRNRPTREDSLSPHSTGSSSPKPSGSPSRSSRSFTVPASPSPRSSWSDPLERPVWSRRHGRASTGSGNRLNPTRPRC